MKDFYSIKDFYNSLQNPDRVPTTHRHFQVYLYPIYYYQNQVVTKGNNNFYTGTNNSHKGLLDMYKTEGNKFFRNWFTEDTIEQFSLAIQSIKFPTSFGSQVLKMNSPFGDYFGVDNDRYYGTAITNEITFTLIDQMVPFFEKKINDWIFTVNRCTIPGQRGTLFPKVNMAIKYFRLDQVSPGGHTEFDPKTGNPINVLGTTPNFIYYFKEAFPTKFDTCTVDHSGSDGEGDLRRTLVFNFNTMYVLHNKKWALTHFQLGYLFDPVTIS